MERRHNSHTLIAVARLSPIGTSLAVKISIPRLARRTEALSYPKEPVVLEGALIRARVCRSPVAREKSS